MADMSWADYVAMVEDSAVRTSVVEHREPSQDDGPGDLTACALVDRLGDGLSLVYSFYDPSQARRSLGAFMILDHLRQAAEARLPYVYLGYWVKGSRKMDYKSRFSPLEVLAQDGWRRLDAPSPQDPGAA